MVTNNNFHGHYSPEELLELGFKKVGENVLLSRRASIYGAENIIIGDSVRIDDFCILSGKIELGSYIHIAPYSSIFGGNHGVKLSDFVNLSSRISIYAVSDDYSGKTLTNPMISDEFKNVQSEAVFLGKHVIIGTSSTVLPGVSIGEGVAIGAHSLVRSSVKEWAIYAGVPCVKIKERSKELLKLETQFLADISH